MKVIFISLLLLTASIAGYGQNCKGVKTEIDKFSKVETKNATINVGKINLFIGGVKWKLEFIQENGETTYKANIAILGEFNQVFGLDTKFYFLLDNDEVVAVTNTLPAKPVTQVLNDGNGNVTVFTTYILTFNLDKEELLRLGKGVVTDVKVEVPDQKIKSPTITKNKGQQLQDVVNCLAVTAK